MNPFDAAAAGMVDLFHQTGGVQITYKRGDYETAITALAESPRMEKWEGSPLNICAVDMTFTIRFSSLVILGAMVIPEKFDQIVYAGYYFDINNVQCIEKLVSTSEWKITAKRGALRESAIERKTITVVMIGDKRVSI